MPNSIDDLCISIRESVMNEKDIKPSDISQLLFNLDVANIKTP